MREPEETPDRSWVDARLDRYLDGELDETDRDRFEQIVSADEILQRELVLARRIQQEFRGMAAPPCPERLTRSVIWRGRRQAAREWFGALVGSPRSRIHVRPAGVIAIATAFLLVIATPLFLRPATVEPDAAAVARATEEARWALAFVSEAGRRTGTSVRDEVLEAHVIRPFQRAMHATLPSDSTDSL